MRKWSDTGLHGNLKVMLLEYKYAPFASVRMNAVVGGLEQGIIMEYELPLNFKFEPDLSSTFSAIQLHLQGEYLGFKFKTEKDKKEFN